MRILWTRRHEESIVQFGKYNKFPKTRVIIIPLRHKKICNFCLARLFQPSKFKQFTRIRNYENPCRLNYGLKGPTKLEIMPITLTL